MRMVILKTSRRLLESTLRRSADALEKLAVGSALVGIFKDAPLGVYIGVGCFVTSIVLTAIQEGRK